MGLFTMIVTHVGRARRKPFTVIAWIILSHSKGGLLYDFKGRQFLQLMKDRCQYIEMKIEPSRNRVTDANINTEEILANHKYIFWN